MKEFYNELHSLKYEKAGEDVDFKIVLKDKNKLFIYFLGSNSDTDWKNNFNFPAKVYKKQESCIMAHRGFAKAYKSANDIIFEKIKSVVFENNLDITNTTVVFVGHSFGGAMAVLAAEDFYYRYDIRPNLITYGAPRVIFGKKAKNYVRGCIADAFQYAHRNDIVTYVPPFFTHISKNKLGKFNFFGLFNPYKYHLIYGEI